jgi:membrane protein DedA with SNARE-associated domain
MAGMRWRTFLLWNALGGIGWALFFGLLGYWGGEATAELVARLGVGAAVAVIVALAVFWLVLHRRRRA